MDFKKLQNDSGKRHIDVFSEQLDKILKQSSYPTKAELYGAFHKAVPHSLELYNSVITKTMKTAKAFRESLTHEEWYAMTTDDFAQAYSDYVNDWILGRVEIFESDYKKLALKVTELEKLKKQRKVDCNHKNKEWIPQIAEAYCPNCREIVDNGKPEKGEQRTVGLPESLKTNYTYWKEMYENFKYHTEQSTVDGAMERIKAAGEIGKYKDEKSWNKKITL